MKKIINEIINELEKITSISSDTIDGIKIDKNNFKQIIDKKIIKKLCFVDGGNQEIIGSSNFSLQFIRVYYNIFLDNKIESKKYEFFILINSVNEDGIKYKTKIFGDFKELELIFDSFDNTLTGINRAKINSVGNVIRRFAELKVASLIDVNDSVIILDGELEVKLTYENIFMEELFNKVKERNNILIGLSKTTDLFTDNANSIAAVLNKIGKGIWYYKVNENIYFIKLNNSNYVFRLDFLDFDKDVFSLLLNNSRDPVFIGYPYGLVDADRFARVSNNEREYLKLKIISNLKIKEYLNTINAHNILDSI